MTEKQGLKNLERLREICNECGAIDNSYLFAHFTPRPGMTTELLHPTVRMEGLTLMVLKAGMLEIEVNCERLRLEPHEALVMAPDTTYRICESDLSVLDAYILYVSNDFLRNVNMSLSTISQPVLVERPSPKLALEPDEERTVRNFIDILHYNASADIDPRLNVSVASSLVAALFYQLLSFYYKRVEKKDRDSELSRRHNYVRQFMRLLHLHYTRERSVSFYASKLFISPKYLSLLVKEATGKSATTWIDEFVIMEAKNMLRYSGRNVQQVAYALNFQNQSSFGKYFRHRTGMSPSDYQKSF